MNVQQLIEHLGKLDPNLPVFIPRDPEGNGFKEVEFIGAATYDDSDPHEIEVLHPDDDHEGAKPCVVLWP